MTTGERQLSRQALRVLRAIADSPRKGFYGLELAVRVELKTGTVYPLLRRFEAIGWLASEWEQVDPSAAGRPARRVYHLTGPGRRAIGEALEEARAELTAGGTA